MSNLKDNNFICIQSFMVKDLQLKGNELLIYAIIYGFSQAEEQCFSGGLSYLADWTSATKQGVMKNLKSLVEKGFIKKNDKIINNVKFVEYRATEFNRVLNKVDKGVLNKVSQGIKQSLPNNIDNNKDIDNKNIEYIVGYLNEKAGKSYKPTTSSTKKHISARLKEGFTVEDFKIVIDRKVNQWQNDKKMCAYIRPETLFGTKFESYLNESDPVSMYY